MRVYASDWLVCRVTYQERGKRVPTNRSDGKRYDGTHVTGIDELESYMAINRSDRAPNASPIIPTNTAGIL